MHKNYAKTVTITIDMSGDAFYPQPFEQVYSILSRLMDRLQKDQDIEEHALLDDNGLTVGHVKVDDE